MKKCLVIRVPSENGWTNCRIEDFGDGAGIYVPVDEYSIRVAPLPATFEVTDAFPDSVCNGDRYFEVVQQNDKWEE